MFQARAVTITKEMWEGDKKECYDKGVFKKILENW